tara:strand:- start:132 stop:833 length:702 start_codon:yes stop_codon:yes gene_type:complete
MIWSTGCSHTYGDDLEDKNLAWPHVLADMLGVKCSNNAISGGSNDRIVYETVKADPADLYIIAWTYTERFTRYDQNNHQTNFNPSLVHSMYSNRYEFTEYGKIHYAFWHNQLYSFKLWLQQIILLQRYLESNNQKYLMLNADNNNYKIFVTDWLNFNQSVKDYVCFDQMSDIQLQAEHAEIQQYIDDIRRECYYKLDTFCIKDLHDDYPLGNSGHLLAEGHREIANRLYNCLN